MARRLTETFYITLRRHQVQSWTMIATRIGRDAPRLKQGECSVKISVTLPEEAFEPAFIGPRIAFEIGEVLRAPIEVTKEK